MVGETKKYEVWVGSKKGVMVRFCSSNTFEYCYERAIRIKDLNPLRTVDVREVSEDGSAK